MSPKAIRWSILRQVHRGRGQDDGEVQSCANGTSASSFVTPSAMAPQDEAICNSHPHPEETRSVVTKDGDERFEVMTTHGAGTSFVRSTVDAVRMRMRIRTYYKFPRKPGNDVKADCITLSSRA